MCLAAMEAWQPSAVVFDLRECGISAPNRWDRDTHELLTVFGEMPEEIEVAVVASEANREPLRGLLTDVMAIREPILFASVEDALAYVGRGR